LVEIAANYKGEFLLWVQKTPMFAIVLSVKRN
jgi:hypothetical protein